MLCARLSVERRRKKIDGQSTSAVGILRRIATSSRPTNRTTNLPHILKEEGEIGAHYLGGAVKGIVTHPIPWLAGTKVPR